MSQKGCSGEHEAPETNNRLRMEMIDSANTINLKLFPTYPNPAPVYDYQVPISTVNLEALIDVNWDMTMQRITRYINGVSSVKRIAEYADVETGLARMCMEHLL